MLARIPVIPSGRWEFRAMCVGLFDLNHLQPSWARWSAAMHNRRIRCFRSFANNQILHPPRHNH